MILRIVLEGLVWLLIVSLIGNWICEQIWDPVGDEPERADRRAGDRADDDIADL